MERSKSRQIPINRNWTLAWQFSKNYIDWILASPIIQSGNGLAFPKANAGPFFFLRKRAADDGPNDIEVDCLRRDRPRRRIFVGESRTARRPAPKGHPGLVE